MVAGQHFTNAVIFRQILAGLFQHRQHFIFLPFLGIKLGQQQSVFSLLRMLGHQAQKNLFRFFFPAVLVVELDQQQLNLFRFGIAGRHGFQFLFSGVQFMLLLQDPHQQQAGLAVLDVEFQQMLEQLLGPFVIFLPELQPGQQHVRVGQPGILLHQRLQDFRRFFFLPVGQQAGRLEIQGFLVVRLQAQNQLGLGQGLLWLPPQHQQLAQIHLGFKQVGIQLHRLVQRPVGAAEIVLLQVGHPQHLVGFGKFLVHLQGVFKFQGGLDVVPLFIQGHSPVIELHFLVFRAAAGGNHHQGKQQQEYT